jgi:regulator of replication initiation timing
MDDDKDRAQSPLPQTQDELAEVIHENTTLHGTVAELLAENAQLRASTAERLKFVTSTAIDVARQQYAPLSAAFDRLSAELADIRANNAEIKAQNAALQVQLDAFNLARPQQQNEPRKPSSN